MTSPPPPHSCAKWLPSYPSFYTAKSQYRNFETYIPGNELRCLSSNFHFHVSVSNLYIPTIGLPFLLQEICGSIVGIYKSLTDKWMWKLGLRLRNSFSKNTYHKWDFRCSVLLPVCIARLHSLPFWYRSRSRSRSDPDQNPTRSFIHTGKILFFCLYSHQCPFTLFNLSHQCRRHHNFSILDSI